MFKSEVIDNAKETASSRYNRADAYINSKELHRGSSQMGS